MCFLNLLISIAYNYRYLFMYLACVSNFFKNIFFIYYLYVLYIVYILKVNDKLILEI